jgi:hypothetical protein
MGTKITLARLQKSWGSFEIAHGSAEESWQWSAHHSGAPQDG